MKANAVPTINEAPAINIVTGPPAFDPHHPPATELIDKCVHCGFCLQTCPTYVLWGDEMDSPRGRIYLMKMGNEGQAVMDSTYVGHFDACLSCMACMTACPSGVDYEKLINATRAQIERNYRRPWTERLFRKLIFAVMPYSKRLRMLRAAAWLYQKSGLQWLMRSLGLTRLLPARLRSMEMLMPEVRPAVAIPTRVPAQGIMRKRVGVVLGCVQQTFLSHVNAATVRVLSAEGCDVIIPQPQPCCGALMVHAGLERDALSLAKQLIDTFERENVDAIVINAAGCGSSVKEYGHLLRDDPQYRDRAAAFAARCKDVSELLAELGPRAERRSVPLRVAYHDSCHLQHAQHVVNQPRQLLGQIPGLELVDLPEAALCCGSAGIYNLVEPRPAEELGARKAGHVMDIAPDVVATGNPGCLLQITAALRKAGSKVPVMHTVELLDAAIRGVPLNGHRS